MTLRTDLNQYLVDAMLGKLGRWLRILGFDVEIVDNQCDDTYVIQVALRKSRHLTTRDYELYQRFKIKTSLNAVDGLVSCYLHSNNFMEQLVGFFLCFNIDPHNYLWTDPLNLPFSPRCSVCNAILNKVSKDSILDVIHQGTKQNFDHFWQCSNENCSKIYWRGSHWQDIMKTLEKIINLMNFQNPNTLFQC